MSPKVGDDPRGRHRVFVIGATGGVGRRLLPLLHEQDYEVTGTHRSPDAADAIRGAGATPVHFDLAAGSIEALEEQMRGHDAVVFCAGAGGAAGDVNVIDGEGPAKAAAAATGAGIKRFVLVSVFMDAWRGRESPGEGFEAYMRAKRAADVSVAAAPELDYVIVRPGTLTDGAGTGSITAGTAIAYGTIPRDDVARFISAILYMPHINRTAVEITAGPSPVDAAIAALSPRQAVL